MKHHLPSTATWRHRARRGALARPVLVFLLVVLGASGARAATLDLVGPAGAEVVIDGDVRGVLPLPRPLNVDPGEFVLQVRARGYVTHEEVVAVDSDEQAIVIDLDLMPLSRWQAMGSSAVLAGLGQLYQGRGTMGWTMMALQIGAWSWLFVADDQYKTARDDYLTALTEYEGATTVGRIEDLREEALTAFDDVESKNDLRTYATITVIAIGAWSVYDAWRAHGGFFEGDRVESPVQASVTRDADGPRWEVGYRWTF